MDKWPPYARRFLETLEHDVGLVVVLRGHLYVEAAIDKLLLTKISRSKLRDLTFSWKVRTATDLDLMSAERADAARALNRIRNKFAHQLERDRLTEADDDCMKGGLTTRLAAKARDCVSSDPDKVVGGWTRAGIAAMHNELQHALVERLVDIRHAERAAHAAPSDA